MGFQDKIYDKEHAEFMNQFIVDYKSKGWGTEHEVPYNFYGQRGFIDVILFKEGTLLICELKPKLTDIGDTIRAIKQAQNVFLKANPSYSSFRDVHFLLVLKATDENLSSCNEYLDLLKGLEILFWSQDKLIEEELNTEYKSIVSSKADYKRSEIESNCIVCKKQIYGNNVMCDKCSKLGW